MCGRFVLFSQELLEQVGQLPGVEEVHAPQSLPGPRYNLAPTQPVAIVRVDEQLAQIDPARWALLPHWKKDLDGPPLFNARAETVATKPSFRNAFKKQRCLVPMNGYYEWKDKQPYYISLGEGLLWAAGLWETGMDRLSTTIITTAATDEMAWLHHRQPRFLTKEEIRPWLAGELNELEPTPLRGFESRPAAREVGAVRNDYPELIKMV